MRTAVYNAQLMVSSNNGGSEGVEKYCVILICKPSIPGALNPNAALRAIL